MKKERIYRLTVPRPQYDRLGSAFELDDTYFDSLDSEEDTVTFTVTEKQRRRFAENAKRNTNHLYWITQMFLPKNINHFEVSDG